MVSLAGSAQLLLEYEPWLLQSSPEHQSSSSLIEAESPIVKIECVH